MIERREDLEALDRADPLKAFRAEFHLPQGLLYLDGNSLGALPHRVRERISATVEKEWGEGLIGSWNGADWISLPQRCGDKVAKLVGAAPGQVVATDSTSIVLFKALAAALRANPGRKVILSEQRNFPTDLYVIEGLVSQLGAGYRSMLVEGTNESVERALAEHGADVGVVVLTHIHYTTSRIYDMQRITKAAHAAGALIVWDLSHSAGVYPVELDACEADFAVGCGYKHLNAGPGSPAFIYVAERFHEGLTQPLSGWMGDARPFEFLPDYAPATGITRYLSGTPAVVGTAALEAAVELILEAPMPAIRAKSIALGDAFVELVERHCAGSGLELISPREGKNRGSHLSYRHPQSYPLMQALIARGVVGDCRPPDLVRFGFAPLYQRHTDIWDAVAILADVLARREWDQEEYRRRKAVT